MIETERLILRKLNKKDANDVFEYLSNIDMHCFLSLSCKSIKEVKRYIKKVSKDETHFAIVLKENNKVIGEVFGDYCKEFAIDGFSPCILFNKEYRKNGYGFETMNAYLEFLFNTLNIRRVYAFVEDYNKASYTMCEKLGMKREGYFREFCYFLDDENGNPIYENSYQYSILKHEWNAIQKNKN